MNTSPVKLRLQNLITGKTFDITCINRYAPTSPTSKGKSLIPEMHYVQGGKQEQYWRDPVENVLYAIVNPV